MRLPPSRGRPPRRRTSPDKTTSCCSYILHTILLITGIIVLLSTVMLPYLLMGNTNFENNPTFVGVSSHLRQSAHAVEHSIMKKFEDKEEDVANAIHHDKEPLFPLLDEEGNKLDDDDDVAQQKVVEEKHDNAKSRPAQNLDDANAKDTKLGDKVMAKKPDPLVLDAKIEHKEKETLARGLAGLPFSQTPALEGAKRATITCDDPTINANFLAYWNEPQGTQDVEFESPFAVDQNGEEKYLTFEPDRGGWNNIRMTLEIIFIIALATGRTLVLPPDQPLYLLKADSSKKQRSFADFFPISSSKFEASHLRIITTEEFLRREGGTHGRLPINEDISEAVLKAQNHCEQRLKSDISCIPLHDHLRSVGYVPKLKSGTDCLVFDVDAFQGNDMSKENEDNAKTFCSGRGINYVNASYTDPVLVHLQGSDKNYRLLNHFYGFLHFTNPVIDNHFKRFVRDYMHYIDPIYCASAKIIQSLQEEGVKRGFTLDKEQGGGFSSLHVRRGELQYKKVKISAEEWYENTKDLWEENEILYIATDERNKTFFDPIKEHHDIRFLDDYWDMANLGDLDPNYMGMIDTIVASRGRKFVGTYFSTFSGYIVRMRGYHGMSMKDSYYGTLQYKNSLQEWTPHKGSEFSHEWPSGWIGIDGDTVPSHDKF